MCKLMYPYVPDNMRSPEGVQLMMSDPEIRDQLEAALQQAFKAGWPSPLCHVAAIALKFRVCNCKSTALGCRPYTWVIIQLDLCCKAGKFHDEHLHLRCYRLLWYDPG